MHFYRYIILFNTLLIGFGTDIQCAYLGVDGDLFTALKQRSPTIINTCKPVALVAKRLSKDVPYSNTFDVAVFSLMTFYHDNRGKLEGLQEIGDVMENLELKQPNDFWCVDK